ncbi:NAD(P)-dependent oxidoreductase [Streptomyces roseicoloratus]|uniref:NAD(P)-binding domain-containing protein n=1 Tax=Streptomyces roseicoloratus TaxID=2508722 RepID=A0ABY9RTW6_9ACTN|nr:NAD(P)-binding domain-containing protein [Streptomyces roseicoloratus]WMX45626.1 NAD(P)-binding domain-containing protein [Streptomyces roseicoloratus]
MNETHSDNHTDNHGATHTDNHGATHSSTRKESVTVLGLGRMGSALAGAFLDAGHPTTVFNRSPGKADPLVARGARRAATVAEAVAASGLVVVCVLDYDAVRGLLEPVAAELRGRTLVNLTSGSPEQARAEAEWAAGHGIGYLDGGIMTTPPGIGDSANMILYAGGPELQAAHRPALSALGDPVDLGPDAGLASLYDAGLLGLMWSVFGGWLHATALVGADGVPAKEFTAVSVRWLRTVSWFLTMYADQIDAGEYPGDDATIDIQVAGIGHLLHAGEERGIDGRLPRLHLELMKEAVAAGHGGDSYARIVEAFRGKRSA